MNTTINQKAMGIIAITASTHHQHSHLALNMTWNNQNTLQQALQTQPYQPHFTNPYQHQPLTVRGVGFNNRTALITQIIHNSEWHGWQLLWRSMIQPLTMVTQIIIHQMDWSTLCHQEATTIGNRTPHHIPPGWLPTIPQTNSHLNTMITC